VLERGVRNLHAPFEILEIEFGQLRHDGPAFCFFEPLAAARQPSFRAAAGLISIACRL
jgi:hypothetical protein